MKTWFEIGRNISDNEGTKTVFSSNSLDKCLKYWNITTMDKTKMFIDIWTDKNNPVPIGKVELYEN